MASSDVRMSSEFEYQVFLSFSRPDTGAGFTDFLYHRLANLGILAYRDEEEFRIDDRIDELLERAIKNSKIYIPIFSRTYATSHWCLRELAQIVENYSQSEDSKQIQPIFFDVESDDVRLKTSLYRDDILNLKHEKKLSNEQVEVWRKALEMVGAIKGWEVKKFSGQSEVIKKVVNEVQIKLKTKYRSVTKCLVGIDDLVQALAELLDMDGHCVQLIKIYGMGGIGKTTLAKVIFNQLSRHFKKCCFLDNVREISSRTYGLLELQERLIAEIGHPATAKDIDDTAHGMERIAEVLSHTNVLIILDDVDTSEQVETLVGTKFFFPGSKILITTRNKDVWQTHRLMYQMFDYEMKMMSTDHALKLFSKHAFNKDSPSDYYNGLSRKIIATTGRLPLAVEVIGSFLYNKNQEQWKQTLDELRKAPHMDVYRKLKISYDALTIEQKQIFLDIACFFIDKDKTNAIYMWEDCGLFPNVEVDVLNSKCLIKIVENNKFWMHDQIRDLGREIVRQENQRNPEKCRRLWICDKVLHATRTEEIVQALYVDTYPRSSHDVVVQSEEIGRFEHLRFLKLTGGTFVGDIANSLSKLRWISWNHPSRIYEWTNICLNNVAILEFLDVDCLDDSRLQDLIKMAEKLKVLSLESCHNISKTPNFSGCSNLKRLTMERCSNLRKIDESIGKLKFLIDLKISECSYLEYLPEEIGDLVNLEHLFVRLHKVVKLPDSIWKLKLLREVHFDSAIDVLGLATTWELPSTIGMLKNLEVLIVRNYYLGQLPFEIGSLPLLRTLVLSHIGVHELPETVGTLPCLQRLELIDCNRIQELPALPVSLTHLRVSSTSLQMIPDLSKLTNLVELDLDDIGQGGDKSCINGLRWIWNLWKLRKLSLRLQSVPAPPKLDSLALLKQLDLFGMDLQTIQQLPSYLEKLGLDNVNLIASPSLNLRNLSCLKLYGSRTRKIQLDGLQLPHLRELLVDHCAPLRRFRLSAMRKMKEVHVRHCKKLIEIQFSRVLESLEVLYIDSCQSLGRLVYEGETGHNNAKSANDLISSKRSLILPSSTLIKLQSFTLIDCPNILKIEVIGMSESWEHFDLQKCANVQSLGDLSNLKNLKSFHMYKNNQLRVVRGLDKLEFLNSLQVHKCGSLEGLIDVSSTKLPNHCCIHISGSTKKFRGSLESYKHPKEQERDFKQEQEQESDSEQEQESDFEQEHELKPRRRLGTALFLLIIGAATCVSALFLSKASHMSKKKIGASGR